jgi:hypothetical protein
MPDSVPDQDSASSRESFRQRLRPPHILAPAERDLLRGSARSVAEGTSRFQSALEGTAEVGLRVSARGLAWCADRLQRRETARRSHGEPPGEANTEQ